MTALYLIYFGTIVFYWVVMESCAFFIKRKIRKHGFEFKKESVVTKISKKTKPAIQSVIPVVNVIIPIIILCNIDEVYDSLVLNKIRETLRRV